MAHVVNSIDLRLVKKSCISFLFTHYGVYKLTHKLSLNSLNDDDDDDVVFFCFLIKSV